MITPFYKRDVLKSFINQTSAVDVQRDDNLSLICWFYKSDSTNSFWWNDDILGQEVQTF